MRILHPPRPMFLTPFFAWRSWLYIVAQIPTEIVSGVGKGHEMRKDLHLSLRVCPPMTHSPTNM